MARLDEIIALVCAAFTIEPEAAQSLSTNPRVMAARHASIWLAAANGHAIDRIGEAFRLHPISVRYVIQRFDDTLRRDTHTADRMIGLARRILELSDDPECVGAMGDGEFW